MSVHQDGPRLRVIGVSIDDVSDWSQPLPSGKWSQFFKALAGRVDLVDIVRPRLSTGSYYLNLARSVRADRARWLAQAGFNQRRRRALDATLQRELTARRGSYDLVVQLQTLCSPRSGAGGVPYVIYTDNTMALTQRIYSAYAPLTVPVRRAWEAFESDVSRHARAVYTFSELARRSMIDDYGCQPARVAAVGAGANQMLETLEDRSYARPTALFVGNPFAAKGGEVLRAAWPRVRDRIADAELVIVGPGTDPQLSPQQGVRFAGWVEREQLARLYREASVFVLPSMFDAWGHVFVEAMGHGLPCIGSDCCAMPELITDGVSGRLVARGDAAALADALIELLGDHERAAAMGRAGFERVRTQLTWNLVVDRLLSHLSETAVAP